MWIVWNLICGMTLGMLAFSWRLANWAFCRLRREPCLITSEQLGQQAEWLVARFFMRRGFTVLGQRERMKSAELDMILVDHRRKGEEIIVVEVKASFHSAALPHRRFTFRKRKRIELAATEFVRLHHLADVQVRLELATVVWGPSGLLPSVRRFPIGEV